LFATRAPRKPLAPPHSRLADTPYRLLWFTGIVSVGLCLAAFALWGLNGAGTLFDMIAAFCT
jgi:hypothetical protein